MLRRTLALAFVAACGPGGGFPDAAIPDAAPTGTFSLTWTVVDQDNEPLPCERIAATTMTVLTHNKTFEGGSTQIFTCKEGMGTSQQVAGGRYDLNFELSGLFGVLDRGDAQFDVDIPPGTNTELAPVAFQVEARGNVAFTLASGQSGGNCVATGAGGAGIDTFTITMNRTSDQACAPLTLNISAGATRPGGAYTIDCDTPAVFGCIEADQMITANDIDSDGYTLHIRGRIGATECYKNDDMIQVPPLQGTLTRQLNLAHQMVTGC